MTIYQDKTTGRRIEVSDSTTDPIIFCAQGGDFQCRMPLEEFEYYEVAPAPTFERATVTAEFLPDDVVLPCYSNGERWNGLDMPYFDRAAVDRLIELIAGSTIPIRWADNGADVIVMDEDYEGGFYTLESVTMPDGVLAWPVGAGSWTWDSCEPVKEQQ